MNGLQAFLVLLLSCADASLSDTCRTAYLLQVAPYPTPAEDDGWDKGREVIPAGRVAISHINSHSNLLRDLPLEIVNIPSLPCAENIQYSSFVEVISILTSSQQRCIFGVIGLYCSSVATILVPPLNHPNFGFIQLTSATSPLLRNTKAYPYLYSSISSTKIYNDAAMEMIMSLNWSRISVVFDYQQLFFRSTGMSFSILINDSPNISRIAQVPLAENTNAEIGLMFDKLFSKASRIAYLSVTIEESGRIMCEAYRRGLIWPNFAFIFVDRTLDDILSNRGECSQEEIMKAADGVFFLQIRLKVSNETVLVSGRTYREYHNEYLRELRKESDETGMNLTENEYGNTLYDQVWSFALALNDSIGNTNTSINDSFANILHQIGEIRTALSESLKTISFQGASGYIQYGSQQETHTDVEILQIRNRTLESIGIYHSNNNSLVFNNNSFKDYMVPPDSFATMRYRIHWGVGTTVIFLQGIVLAVILVSMVSVIHWRKQPEIKSTSIYVSFAILVGCLMLGLAPLVRTVVNVFDVSLEALAVLCNLDLWFTIPGLTLITTSLLFRLLRVVRVFSSYHPTGKYWSDKYVILYILGTTSVSFLFLIVWVAADPLTMNITRKYQSRAALPFFLEVGYCSCNQFGVWVALWFSWITIMLLIVIFLAVQTRKIKRKHFKDTKKVNAFVFSIPIVLTLVPVSYFLTLIDQYLLAYLFRVISDLVVVLLCQLLLFLPKYVPLLMGKKEKRNIKSGLGQVFKSFDSTITFSSKT